MTQSWNSLLFAHWRVDVAEMRRAVPDAFDLDLFGGEAWLGVVPFYMTNVGLRAAPALPWLSAFPELNVRTYVRVADRPGVYFFSLDAGRRLAVAAARALLNLPYYAAAMSVERREAAVHYRSARRHRSRAQFNAIYEPASAPFTASVGSIEYFLTERYCLYHHDHRGRPYRLEIHHRPWSLQLAGATITINTMTAASRLTTQRLTPASALRSTSRRGRMGADASVGTAINAAYGTSLSSETRRRAGCDVHMQSETLASSDTLNAARGRFRVSPIDEATAALVTEETGTDGISFDMPTTAKDRRRCRTAEHRDASRSASRDDTR